MIRVRIENDPDCPNPLEYTDWKFVSFNMGLTTDEERDDYVSHVNQYGEVVPGNIGIERKISTGTAFWLSCYRHSGDAWSLMNEGQNDRWDTTRVAGILLWTGKPKEICKENTYEARREAARNVVDIYSTWADGTTYWYEITRFAPPYPEDFDPEHDDPEFVGLDEQEIQSIGDWIGEDEMVDEINRILLQFPGEPVQVTGDAAWIEEYHPISTPEASREGHDRIVPATPGERTDQGDVLRTDRHGDGTEATGEVEG